MSPLAAPLWVVASAGTAERWAAALDAPARPALALAWSAVRAVAPDPEALAAAGADGGCRLLWLTSPNALLAPPPTAFRHIPAACVGPATAAAARAAGLEVRLEGAGTGADLARTVVAREVPGRVLFLRGRDARREGLEVLRTAGFEIVEVEVYAAEPRAAFAAQVATAPPPCGLVVGSPRGAEALDRALGDTGRGDVRARPALAVGRTTGDRLRALGFVDVRVPAAPGIEGLGTLARAVGGEQASP